MKNLPRLGLPALLVLVAAACTETPEPESDIPAPEAVMPDAETQALIELPPDFGPEGIAVADDYTFYVGSLAEATAGQILAGDLRTGQYSELVAPTGTTALGIRYDPRTNLIYVAGGGSGLGHAYDADTGAQVAEFPLTEAGSTINDVEVTPSAVYFTNSSGPTLYRVELGPESHPGEISTIDLPENFGVAGQCEGAPPIMGNGIAATPDGRYLILIHMSEGAIYRMDTETNEVLPIELTGGDLCFADGLLLDGTTLYGVQNFLNQVAVVDLGPDYLTGTVRTRITEPFASNDALAIPTTIGQLGDNLYAVTAGFAPPSPDYVVRIEKP